ncbi:GntR family transcriptional regulator [Pseudarthrobacter sp. NamE2]|uniref:cache domain-containing protein n=1 Tax=Pseudarthrobacter sp. NamE2 TaxID=2576838 RepID=UPI0010FEEB49|nr:cache domain-containing protein [Pseudarthrobacter sp. NamE2]TLM81970.1 GntR family transcriptional regulator [Pseudarthrobacter sp. NamE2]
MTTDNPAAKAAAEVAAWMNSVSKDVYKFAESAGALWTNRSSPLKVTPKDIAALETMSKDFLGKHTTAIGAGVIFSVEAIENPGGILEWWTSRAQGIEKLEFDLTPGGERFYDYQNMPFFASARNTGKQSMWGPYLDYLGLDEYILTHTAPIQLAGTFIGVAGYDIRIRKLEELFMPALRAIPGDAALLNENRSVVVGNSGAYLVGERLRTIPDDKQLIPVDAPHLGLSLLTSQ